MITIFDRWDNQIGALDCLSATHKEELNGEDVLTVKTYDELVKGYRLVWQDKRGIWHEHIVDTFDHEHDATGKPILVAKCLNSIVETYGDWISDSRPTNASATSALIIALAPTRWSVGTVEITGSLSKVFYHISAREAIQEVIKNWGGELQTDITVSGDKVTARKVSIRAQRGFDTGKRFVYSKDLINVKRHVASDDVKTALYGYGKGEEVGDGYGRRISFTDVNNGKEYIEDNDLKEIWGLPDGSGGKKHSFGVVIFEDCEDPKELLQLTKDAFPDYKEPKVSYECSVIDLEKAGFDHEGSGIGDVVAIIDHAFPGDLRIQGRVTCYEQDLLTDEVTITLGNFIDNMSSFMADQAAALNSLQNRSSNWDVAAYTPGAYLEQVMKALNAQFEAAQNYYFQSFEQGMIWSTIPMDEEGKPIGSAGAAMQLTGEGFRIANSRASDGSWNWRTFGTGDGFYADQIIAGRLLGDNTYFDLNTGELHTQGTIDGVQFSITISPTKGMQIYQGSTYIGGVEIFDGGVFLRADRAGMSRENFLTTGTTSEGWPGFEAYGYGKQYFRTVRGGNTVFMEVFGEHILSAASKNTGMSGSSLRIQPPGEGGKKPYIQLADDQIVISLIDGTQFSLTSRGIEAATIASNGATQYFKLTKDGFVYS